MYRVVKNSNAYSNWCLAIQAEEWRLRDYLFRFCVSLSSDNKQSFSYAQLQSVAESYVFTYFHENFYAAFTQPPF